MKIITNKKSDPKHLSASELEVGEVYKIDGGEAYVMKIVLSNVGSRFIYLATGRSVTNPSDYKYWPVKAELVVS